MDILLKVIYYHWVSMLASAGDGLQMGGRRSYQDGRTAPMCICL